MEAARRVQTPVGVLDLIASEVFVWASVRDGFVSVKLRAGPDGVQGEADRRARRRTFTARWPVPRRGRGRRCGR